MYNTSLYTDRIITHLHLLASIIRTKNSLNLTDSSIHAENLFCAILNKAFNWHLENANRTTANHDSFDLKDDAAGMYIQVTSNKAHSTKKHASIKSFQKRTSPGDKKQFNILFITENVSQRVLAPATFKGFTYRGWDLEGLIKDILQENTLASQLEPIDKILQDEFTVKLLSSPTYNPLAPALGKPILTEKSKNALNIRRDNVTNALYAFTQAGNGLLVGGPGEGKSHLTLELQRRYLSINILCYIIHIDRLINGTDAEISQQLPSTGDWLEALSNTPLTPHTPRPLLIFDAFDAAKALKPAVLHHIQRALNTLQGKWSILVSARIYDASKSIRLMELFPSEDPRNMITCRNFRIPLLNMADIRTSLRKKNAIASLDKCTPRLREILRTPYFLTIFYDLAVHSGKGGKKEFESIETEEQLLEILWRKKVLVDSGANTALLLKVTEQLSNHMTLACKRADIAQESNAAVIDELLSGGVLSESNYGLTLSFAHNILLDYAISIYVISERPADLIRKLEESNIHMFLYRSAYIYFYNRLWRLERALFWKHFESIRKIETPAFRLFRQIILHNVIGNLYQTSDEILTPLSKLPAADRSKALLKLLATFRSMNKVHVPDKEFQLIHNLSEQLDTPVMWIVGLLLNRSITQAVERGNTRLIKLCAKASANYLQFALEKRKIATSRAEIDQNGLHWGILNLCLTLKYNRREARESFPTLLDLLKESGFHIPVFHHLVDKLEVISTYEPRLAAEIFKRIYAHAESSDIPTNFGADVTLTLRSNRGQDFQSNRYALERAYPTLLEKHPQQFLPLGIDIVNSSFCRIYSYESSPKKTRLLIDGIKTSISPDYLRYLNAFDKKNDEESFVTNIVNYLQSLADKRQNPLLRSTIKVLIANFEAASLWKVLIQFLFNNLPAFKIEAYALLKEKKLIIFPETYPDVPDLLKKAYPILSKRHQQHLHSVIASIQPQDYPSRNTETIEKIRTSLLSCILPTADDAPPNPRPSTERPSYMRRPELPSPPEQTSPLPAEILADIAQLTEFSNTYEGNTQKQPRQEDYLPHLSAAQRVFQFRTASTVDVQDLYECDYQVSRYAKIISRPPAQLTSEVQTFAETVAFFLIDSSQYRPATYQIGSLSGGARGFTPDPRIYSTEVLLHLSNLSSSKDIMSRLSALFTDNNETVRWMSVHALPHFWSTDQAMFWAIAKERIPNEENPLCLQLLIQDISAPHVITADQPAVEDLAISAYRVVSMDGERLGDLFQAYAILLVMLHSRFNSTIAADLLQKSVAQKSFLSSLIFTIVSFINPFEETNNYEDDNTLNHKCFSLLADILTAQFKAIGTKSIAQLEQDDVEPIDTVTTQLYYTIVLGKKRVHNAPLDPIRKQALYPHLKPVFSLLINGSGTIESGFMVGHTGHYFLQLLNFFFDLDPTFILHLIATTVTYSAKNNITYSQSSLQIIIQLIGKILADYPDFLPEPENFDNVIIIMDHFVDAGWTEAVELTLRLNEIF